MLLGWRKGWQCFETRYLVAIAALVHGGGHLAEFNWRLFQRALREVARQALGPDLLGETLGCILPLDLVHLRWRVRLDKLGRSHEASADPYQHLAALFDPNMYPLLPKLVHAFRLPQEQYFHLFFLRVAVDEVS